MKGKVNIKEFNDHVILYPDNYINDIEGDKLDYMCDYLLKKGIKKFVIDFSGTELINSIGISILIGIIEKVKRHKGVVLFSGLRKVNQNIFNIVGLTKYVPIYRTEREAVDELRGNSVAMK